MGRADADSRAAIGSYDYDDHSPKARLLGAFKVAVYVFNMPWHCQWWTLQQLIESGDGTTRSEKVIVWEENIKSHLSFVSVASTLTASLVVGSIGWSQVSDAHWTVLMFWYGSLMLSLWCVIIAFHLGILFSAYDASSDRAARLLDMIKHRNKPQPRKKSLQVLQMPIALFSWGIISYIIGLAILILEPLWRSGWVRDSWIAIGALVYGILGVVAYVWTASTIYGRLLPDLAQQSNTLFP